MIQKQVIATALITFLCVGCGASTSSTATKDTLSQTSAIPSPGADRGASTTAHSTDGTSQTTVVSPVSYIVSNTGETPTYWSAPLLPNSADAALFQSVAGILKAAKPLPPLGTAPTPGLDGFPEDAVMGYRWVIGIPGEAPVHVTPGIQICVSGATLAKGCTGVEDDLLVNGKPEAVPGLFQLLKNWDYVAVTPLVATLTLIATTGQLTVTGKGWIGPGVTLSVSWSSGAPPYTNLGIAKVNSVDQFSWTGPMPPVPNGVTSFSIVATGSARTMTSKPLMVT